MKHLHFFGCSFTAGDELSDDVWFPWKHECNSQEEYYSRRNPYLADTNSRKKYHTDNKEKAYPARLQTDEYKTYNHSMNGASLRTNIFRVLQLMFSNKPHDVIFIQVPPIGREFYIFKDGRIESIQLASESSAEPIKSYLKAKLNSHCPQQLSVEDGMDMIMIANVAKQKNIPLYFIEFTGEICSRINDLTFNDFNFIKTNLHNEINLISFSDIINKAHIENRSLLGRHADLQSHQEMADKIINMLPEMFSSQA